MIGQDSYRNMLEVHRKWFLQCATSCVPRWITCTLVYNGIMNAGVVITLQRWVKSLKCQNATQCAPETPLFDAVVDTKQMSGRSARKTRSASSPITSWNDMNFLGFGV